MYGYWGASKLGLHQLLTTSATCQSVWTSSVRPRTLLTILFIPSWSFSPSSSSPAGNLKNVTPDALGPAGNHWKQFIILAMIAYPAVIIIRVASCVHEPIVLLPLYASYLIRIQTGCTIFKIKFWFNTYCLKLASHPLKSSFNCPILFILWIFGTKRVIWQWIKISHFYQSFSNKSATENKCAHTWIRGLIYAPTAHVISSADYNYFTLMLHYNAKWLYSPEAENYKINKNTTKYWS